MKKGEKEHVHSQERAAERGKKKENRDSELGRGRPLSSQGVICNHCRRKKFILLEKKKPWENGANLFRRPRMVNMNNRENLHGGASRRKR